MNKSYPTIYKKWRKTARFSMRDAAQALGITLTNLMSIEMGFVEPASTMIDLMKEVYDAKNQ